MLNPNEGIINNVLYILRHFSATVFDKSQAGDIYNCRGFSLARSWLSDADFLAGLQNIPGDVYEAAQLDGINKWQRFMYITLPLLKPTSIFIFITTLIGAFKLLVQPMVMTQGGPVNSTMTVVYYIYQTGFTDRMVGYASSIALCLGRLSDWLRLHAAVNW